MTINGERRNFARQRVLKAGSIVFNSKHCTFDCVVRNRSEMGARLQLETPEIIPSTFLFRIPKDGFETAATVVNRDTDGVGIQFTA